MTTNFYKFLENQVAFNNFKQEYVNNLRKDGYLDYNVYPMASHINNFYEPRQSYKRCVGESLGLFESDDIEDTYQGVNKYSYYRGFVEPGLTWSSRLNRDYALEVEEVDECYCLNKYCYHDRNLHHLCGCNLDFVEHGLTKRSTALTCDDFDDCQCPYKYCYHDRNKPELCGCNVNSGIKDSSTKNARVITCVDDTFEAKEQPSYCKKQENNNRESCCTLEFVEADLTKNPGLTYGDVLEVKGLDYRKKHLKQLFAIPRGNNGDDFDDGEEEENFWYEASFRKFKRGKARRSKTCTRRKN